MKTWEKIKTKLTNKFEWKIKYANRESKKERAMRGILTGIKKKWKDIIRDSYTDREDIMDRKVSIGDNVWNFITIYNKGEGIEIFDYLEVNLPDLTKQVMLIGGDLSVRIGVEGSREEEEEAGLRRSKDKILNQGGRALLSLTERKGMFILNGICDGDEDGNWTYIGPRRDSVIDFAIVYTIGEYLISRERIFMHRKT